MYPFVTENRIKLKNLNESVSKRKMLFLSYNPSRIVLGINTALANAPIIIILAFK